MANNIVIDIDKTAGEVIIPDADCRKAIFLPGVNLSGIKKLIVHRYSTAMQVGSDTGLPEILILDTDETLSGEEIREVAHRRAYAVSYLKYFSILNYAYKEIDGVIYSKDGKVVVACSMELEHVTIPEGTEIIGYDAFKKCKLKSVMLPDSLTEIRSEAFCGCRNLQSVKLGNSVNIIEAGAFSECRSLSEIDIPAGTKAIENYAFSNSGLERVELREGLLLLGRQAFSGTNIKSISLPASIEDMGYNCIGTKAEEVRLSAFTDCFAKACIVTSGPFDLGDKILKVFCNGKYLYLPRYIIPSMSSAAIVSCLLNRQHMGIMVACGVSKRSIMAINYMENVFVVLIPEIIIWLICQKNIFGKVFMNNISELDMIKYGDWFSHCVAVPIMYLAELVIVTVIAGIVPMFIISRMKVAEVIKPVD